MKISVLCQKDIGTYIIEVGLSAGNSACMLLPHQHHFHFSLSNSIDRNLEADLSGSSGSSMVHGSKSRRDP